MIFSNITVNKDMNVILMWTWKEIGDPKWFNFVVQSRWTTQICHRNQNQQWASIFSETMYFDRICFSSNLHLHADPCPWLLHVSSKVLVLIYQWGPIWIQGTTGSIPKMQGLWFCNHISRRRNDPVSAMDDGSSRAILPFQTLTTAFHSLWYTVHPCHLLEEYEA